jgi:hypothetical protein
MGCSHVGLPSCELVEQAVRGVADGADELASVVLDPYDDSTLATEAHAENDGQSVAEGVTLRLTLPDGAAAVKDEDDLSITPPPETPAFERQSLIRMPFTPLHTIPTVALPKFSLSSAPSAVAGPELLLDRGRVIAQFRVETVTHGVTALSRNSLLVMPDSPGTYVLPWEAHVGNLRHPARGSISIRVDERPTESFQLPTVGAVLATREVPVLDD